MSQENHSQNTNNQTVKAANTINSVSFIGLGAMGYLMAGHLAPHFDTVMVYNRTTAKAEQHAQEFGSKVVSLEQAATADVIFSCLPTSNEVDGIIEKLLPHLRAGSVWVDCTSGVPAQAQAAALKLQQQGCYFLDAPVSGQTTGAKAGTLTVMVGGEAEALKYAYPAIDCFAGLIEHVGASGTGFAVKAVNNTLFAINAWACAEGLSVLKAHGVNPSSALTCINHSSGQSMASSNTFPNRVINRQFPKTFTIDLMAKDCGIAIDLQSEKKVPTPVMAQVASLIRAASAQHPVGSADFSEFAKFYETWTNLVLKDD